MGTDDKLAKVYVSIRGVLARAVAGIVPPNEIEDIVQETYVRVCQTKNRFEIASPRSFMLRTARNIALNHVNRAESRLADSMDLDEVSTLIPADRMTDTTLGKVCSDERFSLFCDAVRQLPVQCRRVFVMKKVYGHSQREIATALEISENTVEKHIVKGAKRIRNFMRQSEAHGQQIRQRTKWGAEIESLRRGDGT